MLKRNHRNIITLLCILLMISLTACSSRIQNTPAVGVVTTQVTDSSNIEVDVFEQAKKLGRAINFGNMLEAPQEGDWGLRVEDYYFKFVKEKGFDTIRLPIRFSNKTTAEAPYTINEYFLERADSIIEQALQHELNVIIDLHHFEEMITDPLGQKDKLLAIWEQLSLHYKELPQNVYFEILNEPNGALSAFTWNDILVEAINVIRIENPHRTLIIGGVDWNSINGLYQLDLPEDDRNIIATFHYYGPFLFTHQGAEWGGPEQATLGITWPGPPETPVEPIEASQKVTWVRQFFEQYNTIQGAANPASKETLIQELERAAKWGNDHNRPVFLGEFGAYSKADMDSRVKWTKTVRTEAERLGFSWAYWEFASGFGIYNTKTISWNEELTNALLSNP